MAQKKDAYYFSHDSSASRDIKMLKLKHQFGWEGIGLFWGIVETLRESTDYKFNSDQSSIELLSTILGVDYTKLIEVINKCVELGLLSKDSKYFYSNSLNARMQEMNQRRDIGYKNGIKGGRPTATNNPNKTQPITQTITQTKPLKEKKGKERKEKTAFADSFSSQSEHIWSVMGEQELEKWIEQNQSNFSPRTTRTLQSGRTIANPRTDVPNPFDWGYCPNTGLPSINILGEVARQRAIEQSKRNGGAA
jgi:hypothetical protein